jgi:hypothetical protein
MNKGVALEGMNKKLDALKAYKLALGSAPKNIKQSIEEKIKKLNK